MITLTIIISLVLISLLFIPLEAIQLNTSTLNEMPSQFDTLNQKIKEYQEDPKSNTNNTKYY